MGRKYWGLSPTTINRIAQHQRQRKREAEREALINTSGGRKEGPTTVFPTFLDFDSKSCVSHITFIETKKYRTVERYVTQNYVKYPILSGWKEKSKTIQNTVKLTNANLENLRSFPGYIGEYAFDIVTMLNERLGEEKLYPKWYLEEIAKTDRNEKIKELEKSFVPINDAYKSTKASIKEQLNSAKSDKTSLESNLENCKNNLENTYKWIEKFKKSTSKWSICLTLGLILVAKKIFLKINSIKAEELSDSINLLEGKIEATERRTSHLNDEERKNEAQYFITKNEHTERINAVLAEYNSLLAQIKPLETDLGEAKTFVPVSHLSQFEYRKITGCYIIRNTLNSRCYVGQSKDVLKRLKQHFKGSEPANVIFAEDYYSCEPNLRSKLFEFRIIECKSKDELDSTERYLIAEHNAFEKGYNSTAGNT